MKKLAMMNKKQSSMAYGDNANELRKEKGTLKKKKEVNFIRVYYGSQVQ